MTPTIEAILQEKYAEIIYDSESRIITAKWIGFLKLEEVKFGCEKIIEYIRKYELTSHLSDHTKLKVLPKEVQSYLTGQCFREVEAIGLRKIAVLVSEDIFAQACINNVNTKGSVGNLKIYTFDSLYQCNQWLTS